MLKNGRRMDFKNKIYVYSQKSWNEGDSQLVGSDLINNYAQSMAISLYRIKFCARKWT